MDFPCVSFRTTNTTPATITNVTSTKVDIIMVAHLLEQAEILWVTVFLELHLQVHDVGGGCRGIKKVLCWLKRIAWRLISLCYKEHCPYRSQKIKKYVIVKHALLSKRHSCTNGNIILMRSLISVSIISYTVQICHNSWAIFRSLGR